MFKTMVWDFNGTLLDDVNFCVSIINKIQEKRNIKKITLADYRRIFTFPVIDYYEKAGFDFNIHSFEILSREFIDDYYKSVLSNCTLFEDVLTSLIFFKSIGFKHYIISAMEQTKLLQLTKKFGLTQYFESIWGVEDHYAKGKLQIAEKHLSKLKADQIYYIGDTDHDVEVANILNSKMIMIPRGHQSYERLKKIENINIFNNLTSFIESEMMH